MEWDEPGNPRNIVAKKTVTSQDGSELKVGAMCDVLLREGNKKSTYQARLLGLGKLSVYLMYKI